MFEKNNYYMKLPDYRLYKGLLTNVVWENEMFDGTSKVSLWNNG